MRKEPNDLIQTFYANLTCQHLPHSQVKCEAGRIVEGGGVCEWGEGGVIMNPLLTQKNQTFLSFFHKMEESEKK